MPCVLRPQPHNFPGTLDKLFRVCLLQGMANRRDKKAQIGSVGTGREGAETESGDAEMLRSIFTGFRGQN